MFPIYINDGTTPLPADDICYIVAKEGIFLKKKMGIMDSIAPVTNISILESIQATAQMNIKKIPGGQFARIVAFFREVYKEYYGEAIVLLFYDLERNIYKVVPPHQKVTGAACDYNKGITIEGMQMIGTIHSHASMSAFHSGTDDHDEEHFDGLHITIGNVNQEDVSVTASIVANGHRFVVKPEDYVERLVKTVDIDETANEPTRRIFKWQNGKMVEDVQAGKRYTYNYRKLDKRYKVNVSTRYHKVIPEWMGMVEKGTYTYNYGQYGYGVYGVWDGQNPRYPAPQRGGNRSWGGNYDSNLWRQAGINIGQQGKATTEQGKTTSPYNVGVTVKPIEFPPHDIEIEADGHIPCTTCVFRSHKFFQEQEGIEDPDVYKCEKCESIIVDDTESVILPICPTCKTDEYLTLIADDELPENYISEKEYSHLKREPGIVEDSAFIQCRSCGNGFHLFAGETQCPFCYTLIDEDQVEGADVIDTEKMLADTMRKDSGDYLSLEAAEIAEAAMDEVRKADEIIERIPDPADGVIPIAERKEAVGFFKHFFGQRSKRK
jgi:Zn finger protein HypA/HybF involved in hydrogenase expression